MRGWLITTFLLSIAVYVSWRQGWLPGAGAPEESVVASAAAAQGEAASDTGAPPLLLKTRAVPAKTSPGPSEDSARAALGDAVLAIGAGRAAPLEAVRVLAEQGGAGRTGRAARALLAAVEGPVPGRHRAWTELFETGLVSGQARQALYELVVEASREGVSLDSATGEPLTETVVAGDSLTRICGRLAKQRGLKVSPGMLRWLNRLSGDLIRPGQRLRVPAAPLRLAVSKKSYLLRAYVGGGLVREYGVGIGRDGRTPAGAFEVDSLLVKAPWRNPETGRIVLFGEPGYAIGSRWIGFEDNELGQGLGIHGTDEPESIGKAESLGCIRLRNEHVEDLFELVSPGTQVVIEEEFTQGS